MLPAFQKTSISDRALWLGSSGRVPHILALRKTSAKSCFWSLTLHKRLTWQWKKTTIWRCILMYLLLKSCEKTQLVFLSLLGTKTSRKQIDLIQLQTFMFFWDYLFTPAMVLMPQCKKIHLPGDFTTHPSYSYHIHMGVSKNRGYPQIIHSTRVFHYKPSILGYPYFFGNIHIVGFKSPP